jgi:drug/metabolite transporter (DMT)-like permease
MRLTPAIFLVSGVISVAAAFVAPGHMSLPVSVLATPHVAIDLALLTIFSTLVSFGSMTIFQPRIDPTRATLIYMLEPIFAAAYAWVARGETMTPAGAAGAALILLANFAAEIDLFRRSES